MLTVEEAWERIAASVTPTDPRATALSLASGGVLAEEVVSTTDSPPFDKATMDGFAVQCVDFGASAVELPVQGELYAGQFQSEPLRAGGCCRIMTGAPVPLGAEAVIPVEWTRAGAEEGSVLFQCPRAIRLGMNILPRAAAMRAGEKLLSPGRVLRAPEIALLAEIGHAFPVIRAAPTVGILSTGDELVDVGDVPGPGQIRNSNALMLEAQVRQAGGIPHLLGIAKDEQLDLRRKIQSGLQYDFLCISAGVSAGDADLVPGELQAAGVQRVFHKVAVKPGKPIWFGVHHGGAGQGKARPTWVFGLPGNPVSSMVCFELFVQTAIRAWLGFPHVKPTLIVAGLESSFEMQGDRQTWYPATLSDKTGELRVRPVRWKGSADLRSTVEANCSMCVPPGKVEWARDEKVMILPWGRSLTD